MQEADKPLYRYSQSSMGECWIVTTLQVFDENKDVYNSLLPLFVEDELSDMKAMTPLELKAYWLTRVAKLAEERAERLKHPKRTSFVTEYMDPVKGTLEDVKAMFA